MTKIASRGEGPALISYSQIDQKKEKQEETIERPANQVEKKWYGN